ncbi:MAG: hypothetical protein LCI00_21490 [Chloroflexi bacterium]|nr:hypothetical protein [Chloroflexota bacterium]MCC6895031.1 hypothetical protein [Anaerolineae bacterium]
MLALGFLLVMPLNLLAQENMPTDTYHMLVGDLAFTFDYPAGWITQESVGLTIFASDTDLFQSPADQRELEGDDGLMLVGLDGILYFMWDQFEPIEDLEEMSDWVGGEFALSPYTGINDFTNLEIRTLTNGRQVAISSRPDKSEGFFAGIAVVEFQPKSFIVFYVVMPFADSKAISDFLFKIADSLKQGSEVTFQDNPTVIRNETVSMSGRLLGLGEQSVYLFQRDPCGNCRSKLLEVDFTGEVLRTITLSASTPFIYNLVPITNGQFWAVIDGGMGYGGGTYDIALFSSEGEVLQSLGLNDNAGSITIRSDQNEHLYVVVTDRIAPVVTQPPNEVRREETNTYVMVMRYDGELIRQFPVSSEEYDIGQGINGIAITSNSEVYIADSYGQKGITIFDTEGDVLKEGLALGQVQLQSNITSLDVTDLGDLFIGKYSASDDSGILVHLDANGSVLSSLTADTLGIPYFYFPQEVRLLENGNLLVIAFSNSAIQFVELDLQTELAT